MTRTLDRATVGAEHVVTAGSEYIRGRQMGVRPERLEVVYYGVPAERFDPAQADPACLRAELGVAATAPLIGQVAHSTRRSTVASRRPRRAVAA